MKNRASGILMHITSLAGKYGIGDFGKCAYDFVDFLKDSNQKYWQILPLGVTGYGDSPYQAFSAFAGNPYFIDLDSLVSKNLLTLDDIEVLNTLSSVSIEYDKLYIHRYKILRKAYENFKKNKDIFSDLNSFRQKNSSWLEKYALFMSIKSNFNDISWLEWPREYRKKDKKTMKKAKVDFADNINYHIFLQYLFFSQWESLKKYANDKGIKIIGDIPIFVSTDSVDTWDNPKMFLFDKKIKPMKVAGCPPDNFSTEGQLWGNVLYNWKYIKETKYTWWIERIKSCFTLYDTVRIDHFRGFESYWSIPAKSKTARDGKWVKGPGMDLFNEIKKRLGNLDIIAEDLGFLTPRVHKLLKDSTFPGMKILGFAFDSRDENDYLPHNYPKKSVSYTGTHDNQTIVGWFESVDEITQKETIKYLDNFLKPFDSKENKINLKFIETLWASNSNLVIAPLQDFLGLDDSARMNTPSTLGGNWIWKLKDYKELNSNLSKYISDITKKYKR